MKKTPHGNLAIWRYLPFEKFADLLLRRCLAFPRVDFFSDKNELSAAIDLWCKKKKNKILGKRGKERDAILANFKELQDRCDNLRLTTFVNCWSKSSNESYALWKIYLAGSPNGVAIRTTVSKFKKLLQASDEAVQVKEVEYHDYVPEDYFEDEDIICTKSSPYAYEDEVRFYIQKETKKEIPSVLEALGHKDYMPPVYRRDNCIDFDLDPESFIDSVVISPFSTNGFRRTVEFLMKSHAPSLVETIRRSSVIDR